MADPGPDARASITVYDWLSEFREGTKPYELRWEQLAETTEPERLERIMEDLIVIGEERARTADGG